MVRITNLPCELVAAILSQLDGLDDLVNAVVSCRHLYAAFQEWPSVAGNIVHTFFDPELLPFAVAAQQVCTLPEPRTASAVRDFVDLLSHSDRAVLSNLRSMSLRSIYDMLDTEDAITDLAFDMAECAWQEMQFDVTYRTLGTLRAVGLSPAEAFRFVRAFYRTEIFFKAFKTSAHNPDPGVIRQSQLWLVTSFAQFEIEQIACVHDYLERTFHKRYCDILMRALEFGVLHVDYRTLGDNIWTQRWISQGIVFLPRLQNKPLAAKRAALLSALGDNVPAAFLWKALKDQHELYRTHKSAAALSPRDTLDADSGPPSAFDYANMDILFDEEDRSTGEVVLAALPEDDRGLREMAYVLWDMERMKNWNIWKQIDLAPELSSNYPRTRDIRHMQKLWAYCETAWRKGGRGMMPATVRNRGGRDD